MTVTRSSPRLHGDAVRSRDLLAAYAEYLRSLVDLRGNRPLKVVVDAGNGMGGHTVPSMRSKQIAVAIAPVV